MSTCITTCPASATLNVHNRYLHEGIVAFAERVAAGFAALIVCPIFANEGLPDIPPGIMPRIADLVHREGGLVIADEVQSGYGRTGSWWGYEKTGFRPDIVVMGKPMGNGLPLVFAHDNADEFLGAFDECMEELGG